MKTRSPWITQVDRVRNRTVRLTVLGTERLARTRLGDFADVAGPTDLEALRDEEGSRNEDDDEEPEVRVDEADGQGLCPARSFPLRARGCGLPISDSSMTMSVRAAIGVSLRGCCCGGYGVPSSDVTGVQWPLFEGLDGGRVSAGVKL